jgi:hypothetical protein
MHQDLKASKDKVKGSVSDLVKYCTAKRFLTRVFFDAKSDEIVSIFLVVLASPFQIWSII